MSIATEYEPLRPGADGARDACAATLVASALRAVPCPAA